MSSRYGLAYVDRTASAVGRKQLVAKGRNRTEGGIRFLAEGVTDNHAFGLYRSKSTNSAGWRIDEFWLPTSERWRRRGYHVVREPEGDGAGSVQSFELCRRQPNL